MRKLQWLALALAAAAQAGFAAGPPGRRDGERGPGRGDGGRFDTFRGGEAFGPRARGNAFDALRRYFDLTPEQQAAVAKLDEQRAADEREALSALGKTLDKKFSALILELLPADQKAKYEQVLAALTARDEATEAAQKEFRAVVDKLRADQGVTAAATAGRRGFGPFLGSSLPNSKGDIIRQCLKLTEQQHGAVDGIQRDTWGNMRQKMQGIPRPENWGDAAARQKYAEATRKVREDVENQAAEAMALLLNDEQKKAYQTGAAALEVYNKKVAAADDACEKKLTEIVGPEKAKAMRAAWWQLPTTVQPGGAAPRGENPKGAEF